MLMRRLLALVIAGGLVFAAVQVRARVFPSADGAGRAVDDLRVVCVTELEAACLRLAETTALPPEIEDAQVTVERLATGEPDFDVWVTVAPWPRMAAAAREFADVALPPLASTPGTSPLARSPVVAAAQADRAAALAPTCDGGQLTWTCVTTSAGQPWDDLGGDPRWSSIDVGLPDPATRVDGLLTLTQMAADVLGDGAFTGPQLQTPAFTSWLSQLARGVEVEPPPLGRMLLTGPADYEFTGALEAEVVRRREAPRAADLEVQRLPPPVTATVVVVGYGGLAASAVDDVGERLRTPLAEAGWWVDDAAPPPGATGPAPRSPALPSATTLEALRREWIAARGE